MAVEKDIEDTVMRLFAYANHHAEQLSRKENEESIEFAFDHFLLTLIAAKENFSGGIISADDVKAHPDLAPLRWLLEARNCLAHRSIKTTRITPQMLTVGGEQLYVGDQELTCGWEIQLLPSYARGGMEIAAPDIDLIQICHFAIKFWHIAFIQKQERGNVNIQDVLETYNSD